MDKLAIIVISISIIIGLTPFIIEETTVETNQQVLYSNVSVVGDQNQNGTLEVGVTTVKKLDFGVMPTSVEFERTLNVSAPRKTLLTLSTDGNISDIMRYEDKHYFRGNKDIGITLNASETGYYDGNVTVKTWTAENEVGEKWLDVKSGEFLPSYF